MPADWDRVVPLCSVRRFYKGAYLPVISTRLFAYYEVLQESWPFGASSQSSGGENLLEVIEGIGLVCRGFWQATDTRLTHYTTSGGSWEETRPGTGAFFKYRLYQTDTSANLVWSATSGFVLPDEPECVFTLQVSDTPPDNDATSYPPFVRIEFGDDPSRWALEWSKLYGGRLLTRVGHANWFPVAELPELQPLLDTGEAIVDLRCLRGKICVSCDRGRTWVLYGFPDGSSIPVRRASFTLRGQGNAVGFGLHQLQMATGVFTSPLRNTGTTWIVAPTPTLTAVGNAPGSTTVDLAEGGAPAAGRAGYTATLTPQPIALLPFTFYKSPELYGVLFKYGVVRQLWSGQGFYETPWDGSVWTVDIDKPFELDQSAADLEIRLDPDAAFSWDSGRWPALQIRAGYTNAAGAEFWWTVFTGFAELVEVTTEEHRDVRLRLRLHNPSIIFRIAEWTDLDRFPLGGSTVNAALDAILDSEGLDATHRVWHGAGNLPLPFGRAEDPFEYPRKGEKKWETLQRIASYAGLEVGVLDDGRFATLPRNYVDPFVSFTWEMNPATDLNALVRGLSNSLDSGSSATAVIVTGVSENGSLLYAFAVDGAAESVPASPRFSPWRVTIQEEVPGTTTLGLLIARTQALAAGTFGNHYDVEVRAGLNLPLSRRVQVRVEGAEEAGVANFDRFGVLTLRHHIEHDPSFTRIETEAGLRRLN